MLAVRFRARGRQGHLARRWSLRAKAGKIPPTQEPGRSGILYLYSGWRKLGRNGET